MGSACRHGKLRTWVSSCGAGRRGGGGLAWSVGLRQVPLRLAGSWPGSTCCFVVGVHLHGVFSGVPQVGRTMFETEELPRELVRHVQQMDEVRLWGGVGWEVLWYEAVWTYVEGGVAVG